MPKSLGDQLPVEIKRCKGLLEIYESIPTGGFGSAVIKLAIQRAEKAQGDGDVAEMIRCYNELKELE